MILPDKYCIDLHNYERFPSREVHVGDVPLGGAAPIRVQSMCNVPATDVAGCVAQCKRIFDAGADFVRISTPRIMDVDCLRDIKRQLRASGYRQPLIADVHFNPVIAEAAAKVVEKVRINPGNYVDKRATFKHVEFSDAEYKLELESIHERLRPLILTCKEYGTAIRIGSNYGSLSDRIMSRYGNTVEGMVQSAMEFIDMFIDEGFYDLVVSMKASNVRVMVRSCRLLNARMIESGYVFPQHLGVTEAGSDESGRMKSAVGIGSLLSDGIGDTIRVSLTEPPENEVIFAKKIVSHFNDKYFKYQLPTCGVNTFNPYTDVPVYEPVGIADRKFTVIAADEEADITVVSDLTNLDPAKTYLCDYDLWRKGRRPKNVFPVVGIDRAGEAADCGAACLFVETTVFEACKPECRDRLMAANVCPVLTFVTDNPLGELRYFYNLIGTSCSRKSLIIKYLAQSVSVDGLIACLGIFPGAALVDNLASGIWLETPSSPCGLLQQVFDMLQAVGLRYSHAEFISCPGCGRTDYDLQLTSRRIREAFSHLSGVKIAVMGCIVNGPGEMADADYGCVGSTHNNVHIYRGKTVVMKNIPQEAAVEALKKVMSEDGIEV